MKMQSSHQPDSSSSTARSSASASTNITSSHTRPHSISDPHAFLASTRAASPTAPPHSACPASAYGFYDAQQRQALPDWAYANFSTGYDASYPSSSTTTNANPHVALRATSPQSMVSSRSDCVHPAAYAASTTSSPADTTTTSPGSGSMRTGSGSGGKKSSIDRNRKPCGACSSSKRKCKLIPSMPNLCERCRNHGLLECPPHISWTNRKASVRDSESLSPLEMDEKEFSSRSASPSHFGASNASGAGNSPVGFFAPFPSQNQNQNHHHPADLSTTTQEWVHDQTSGSAGIAGMGGHDALNCYQNASQIQSPTAGLHVPQFVQQNNSGVDPPILPVCHHCQTPYNEYLMLNYVLAALSASRSSPPYELDPAVLSAYGHLPPNGPGRNANTTYQNQNSPNPY